MCNRDRSLPAALAVAAIVWAAAVVAAAEKPGAGVVSGQGSVVLAPVPQQVRVQIVLIARGKDAAEGQSLFKERFEKVSAVLTKMGAVKESIRLDPLVAARVAAGSDAAAVVGSAGGPFSPGTVRFRSSGGASTKDKKAKGPQQVQVTARLTAEFPLDAKDCDAAFLAGKKLEAEIKAAKLAVPEDPAKAGKKPAGEEDGDEDESMPDENSFGEQPRDPNTPSVVFVARISRQQQSKAMAEALAKAREAAGEAAEAAGAKLGELTSFQTHVVAQRQSERRDSMYGSDFDDDSEPGDPTRPEQRESFAPDPGRVRFTVMTSAGFRMEPRGAEVPGKSTQADEKGR